jgi:hypothetical protein
MRKLLAALAIAAATVMPAGATPQSPDYINGGQCAGDALSKCRYTLEIVEPNEEMVVVPGLEMVGPSRISTVEFCAEMYGVEDWSDMVTDLDLDGMYVCLIEHT